MHYQAANWVLYPAPLPPRLPVETQPTEENNLPPTKKKRARRKRKRLTHIKKHCTRAQAQVALYRKQQHLLKQGYDKKKDLIMGRWQPILPAPLEEGQKHTVPLANIIYPQPVQLRSDIKAQVTECGQPVPSAPPQGTNQGRALLPNTLFLQSVQLVQPVQPCSDIETEKRECAQTNPALLQGPYQLGVSVQNTIYLQPVELIQPCSDVKNCEKENFFSEKEKNIKSFGHKQTQKTESDQPIHQAAPQGPYQCGGVPLQNTVSHQPVPLVQPCSDIEKRKRRRKQHFSPAQPGVAYQCRAPLRYLQPAQPIQLFEPCSDIEAGEILPNENSNDEKSGLILDVNSLAGDEESNGFNAESSFIETKIEEIEEPEGELLELSTHGVQDEDLKDLEEEDTEIPLHKAKLDFGENSLHAELTLPVSSSQAELNLEENPVYDELILPVSSIKEELHLEENPVCDELILPVSSTKAELNQEENLVCDELMLPISPSEAQLDLGENPAHDEMTLPVCSSEADLDLEETSSQDRLVLKETPITTMLALPVTQPNGELVHLKPVPETDLAVQVTHSESEVVLQKTLPQPRLVLQDRSVVDKEAIHETKLVLQETSPETSFILRESSGETSKVLRENFAETRLVSQKASPKPNLLLQTTSFMKKLVIRKRRPKARLTLPETIPEGTVLLRETRTLSDGFSVTLGESSSETEDPLLICTKSHLVLAETVMLELKQRLPSAWITLPDEHGIHVVLISRLPEKAIQRRVTFSFAGKEDLSVHRKPVSDFIVRRILGHAELDAVALTREKKAAFVDRVLTVVDRFRLHEICSGADDVEFKHLWEWEENGDIDKNWYGELRYKETFRPNDCDLLVPSTAYSKRRCAACLRRSSELKAKYMIGNSDDGYFDVLNWKGDTTKLIQNFKRLQSDLKQARSQVVMLLKESEDM